MIRLAQSLTLDEQKQFGNEINTEITKRKAQDSPEYINSSDVFTLWKAIKKSA